MRGQPRPPGRLRGGGQPARDAAYRRLSDGDRAGGIRTPEGRRGPWRRRAGPSTWLSGAVADRGNRTKGFDVGRLIVHLWIVYDPQPDNGRLAMARGRPWTPEEDADIIEAAGLNRQHGRFDPDRPYGERWTPTDRLGAVARKRKRTVAAVHKRAQRIAERSYTRWEG